MTADEITTALAFGPFEYRRYLNCPNVSHGWGLSYEADFIAISRHDYATEVEIKVTKSDLLRDQEKHKFTRPNLRGLDPRINKFFYAVPLELKETAQQSLDDRFGIIVVHAKNEYDIMACEIVRKALDLKAKKITKEDRDRLLHLVQCRYWSMRVGKKTVEYEGDAEA